MYKRTIDNRWSFKGSNTKEYTHCYHTYPAMMIPQIARTLIEEYIPQEGAKLILDPYMGSGTSLVEASIKGGIKEQMDTIANRYNKWLYLFLNILFATCYHNNVYISFHFHMGMDHFFRVSYLLQRLLPLSYLVQNQLFE